MNAQIIYDVVLHGMRAQGCPSTIGDEKRCAYRGEGSNRCAVGMWISDDNYQESMERKQVTTLIDSDYGVPPWFEDHLLLLLSLQKAHDWAACKLPSASFATSFELNMQDVADRHGLRYTPPTEVMSEEAMAVYAEL